MSKKRYLDFFLICAPPMTFGFLVILIDLKLLSDSACLLISTIISLIVLFIVIYIDNKPNNKKPNNMEQLQSKEVIEENSNSDIALVPKTIKIEIHSHSNIIEELCVIISRNNDKTKPRYLHTIRSYILCKDSFFNSHIYNAYYTADDFIKLLVFDTGKHVATISYEEDNKGSLT